MTEEENSEGFSEYFRSIAVLLLLNLVFASLKLAVGYIGESTAMRSDGWNNMADFIYTILFALGLWISTRPADESHPEGHGRFESLVALLVGFVILGTGFFVLWDAGTAFFESRHLNIGLFGITVIALSMVGKALVAWFLNREGERLSSSALNSISLDQAGDILADSSVLLAILASAYDLVWIDPIVATVIGFLIIRIAWEPINESLKQLTGQSPDPELLKQIEQCVRESSKFEKPSNIRAHHVGPTLHASLTVKADPDRSLEEIHQAEEKLITDIKKLDNVTRVFIHVEPR